MFKYEDFDIENLLKVTHKFQIRLDFLVYNATF